MGKKKERPFDKLYAELEDIKDARGNLMNTVFSPRMATGLLSSRSRILCSSIALMPICIMVTPYS
jgi:hypothetical protein